ncbi:MAG: hypothetical protein RRY22_01165 [Bacilli bacterium]
MKCNKCGTPIIPGDTYCRFCSTKISDDIEIIDEEPEQIIEIIDDKPIKGKKIKEIDITKELEKTARLEKIDIEEFTGKISKEELEEINELAKEPVIEKQEEKIPVEPEKTEPNNSFLIILVLVVLLIGSLLGNAYLFLNRNKTIKTNLNEISKKQNLNYFESYEISLPDNWVTKFDKQKDNFIIFDKTNQWGASIQVLSDVDFSKIETKKDEIIESLSNNKYLFTSNYNKKVNNMDYYLYKGKYEAYSVYVIAAKIDAKTIALIDLKFKSEVNKEILDTLMKSMSSLKINTLSELNEEGFEFNQISGIVKEKIPVDIEPIE